MEMGLFRSTNVTRLLVHPHHLSPASSAATMTTHVDASDSSPPYPPCIYPTACPSWTHDLQTGLRSLLHPILSNNCGAHTTGLHTEFKIGDTPAASTVYHWSNHAATMKTVQLSRPEEQRQPFVYVFILATRQFGARGQRPCKQRQ